MGRVLILTSVKERIGCPLSYRRVLAFGADQRDGSGAVDPWDERKRDERDSAAATARRPGAAARHPRRATGRQGRPPGEHPARASCAGSSPGRRSSARSSDCACWA
ncbi:hypothetical protein SGPA1_12155 [Streptomyces misionensis JCM 4497]